jgi:DNA helicase-2/ATP-dependent DNA helicase PcrA
VNYLEKLNEPQRQAVLHGNGPILILAGAGSGKTRVLTHRIVHLILNHWVDPTQIFSVTFTNKAAAEMRERVTHILGRVAPGPVDPRDLWISTFHSACVRILRSEIHHLGYANTFTIYDDSDQLSVVKAVMKELHLSDSMYSPKAMQSKINRAKNDGVDHLTYKPLYGGPIEDAFMRIFARYSEVLKASSALDFADLILMTVKLFQTVPQVLLNYQRRFPYLLIDEYQDTNKCQYLLMKLLAGTQANICAVGDEDQSIYKWRGADISNILNFEKDFPNAQIFKLEQNYRSTKNIIEAASHVISYNTERRDKKLFTQNDLGEKIRVVEAYDEHDEAHKVTDQVSQGVKEGLALNQMAIFYRTNAQSRLLEDMLRAKGINYQIYGGLKFYDRLEVKDILAYLKLVSNPSDDVSFRRIINVPTRGIGAVSLEKFTSKARELNVSCYQLLLDIFGSEPSVQFDLGRSQKNFKQFFELVESLRAAKSSVLPSDLINMAIEESGYRKTLSDEGTVESQSRLENLAELRQSVIEYELRKGGEDPSKELTLEGFLEEIALVSDIDRFDPNAPAIKLMTIHMAKGLEFDTVFIVGLEEELFPNIRPWEAEEPSELEEERRLFYVGMTRARKSLSLFYAKNRTVFGNSSFRILSRFVEEIPKDYLELKKADYFSRKRHFSERPGVLPRRGAWQDNQGFEESPSRFNQDDFSQVYEDENTFSQSDVSEESGVSIGSRVQHPTFGEGIVRQNLGGDKLIVEFRGRGLKKISLKFTQLKF